VLAFGDVFNLLVDEFPRCGRGRFPIFKSCSAFSTIAFIRQVVDLRVRLLLTPMRLGSQQMPFRFEHFGLCKLLLTLYDRFTTVTTVPISGDLATASLPCDLALGDAEVPSMHKEGQHPHS
jgi:hypothetical protein